MCSIIGYKGQLIVAPLLVESLKRMEYRGYDSVGIATINNGKIKKGVGKVLDVNKRLDLSNMGGVTQVLDTLDGLLMVVLQKKMLILITAVQIVWPLCTMELLKITEC